MWLYAGIAILLLSAVGIFGYLSWRKIGYVRLRAELERAGIRAERGLTAAVLAHEIRNPLAALRFQLHSLRGNAADQDLVNSTADLLDGELSRIQKLVQDYLEHEKAQSMRPQPVDLGDAARTLKSLVDELLRQTTVTFHAGSKFLRDSLTHSEYRIFRSS